MLRHLALDLAPDAAAEDFDATDDLLPTTLDLRRGYGLHGESCGSAPGGPVWAGVLSPQPQPGVDSGSGAGGGVGVTGGGVCVTGGGVLAGGGVGAVAGGGDGGAAGAFVTGGSITCA